MALFKFRLPVSAGAEAQAAPSQPASGVEVMRRRARHRLIGSAVLVLAAVVVFPIVFDTQPRPISADVSIDIPDKSKAKPITTAKAAAAVSAASSLSDKEELVSDAAPSAASKVTAATPVTAPTTPSATTPTSTATPTAAAQPTPAASAAPRYIVQVGAFADESKSQEVRAKLEKAGLKTYTNVAQTKDGRRVRVRLGPFSTREEADKAAAKIRQLQMQPQVLTL